MAAQAAKRINKVGFLVAMQEEAAPFIGALKLQKRAPHARAPIVVHEGSYRTRRSWFIHPASSTASRSWARTPRS